MITIAALRLAALAGILCLAAPAPAVARQRPDTVPVARDTARTAPVVPLPGPRIRAAWPRAEQRLVPAAPASSAMSDTHTFRLTTLELVLIGVILFLLIVR